MRIERALSRDSVNRIEHPTSGRGCESLERPPFLRDSSAHSTNKNLLAGPSIRITRRSLVKDDSSYLSAASFSEAEHRSESRHWLGHIPFAFWIVEATQTRSHGQRAARDTLGQFLFWIW